MELCIDCKIKPIYIKKVSLCVNCYNRSKYIKKKKKGTGKRSWGPGSHQPRYLYEKDYETNLGKIRVEKNMTIKELCKEAETKPFYYCSLQNGMISPLYLGKSGRGGKIKPWVQKILNVLGCKFSDAFPRHECDLARGELLQHQIDVILISEYTLNKERMSHGMSTVVLGCLLELPERINRVLFYRFYKGKTLEEIAGIFNVTRERIRQLEAEGMRRLRQSSISQKLIHYYRVL